jgi:hypothetical protein
MPALRDWQTNTTDKCIAIGFEYGSCEAARCHAEIEDHWSSTCILRCCRYQSGRRAVQFVANLAHHVEENSLCASVGMIGPEASFLEMLLSARIVPSLVDVSAIHGSMLGILPSFGGLRAL